MDDGSPLTERARDLVGTAAGNGAQDREPVRIAREVPERSPDPGLRSRPGG